MEQISLFLKNHNMHPDGVDAARTCGEYWAEMQAGLKGEPSSLMMLPAYLNPASEIPCNEPVAVLDAGGTNLRVALVTFGNGGATIKGERIVPMPGTQRKLTWDSFLRQLAEIVAPYAKQTTKLGFCFSFPAEITPDIDGKIICFNKEVQVEGAEGRHMCQELIDLLNREYECSIEKFALLNDTVATLLGGYGKVPFGKYDGFVGFILGTGMNCCYIEPSRKMIINMEAGGYGKFPLGTYDKLLDETSTNPGEHYFEKMVSGGYLGTVILETLRGACQEGLFSEQFKAGIRGLTMDMAGISAYLADPMGKNPLAAACETEKDQERLWYVVDALLERAAKMLAVALTAILDQADCGKNPWKPACVVAEGSTFWKCVPLRAKIEYNIRRFTEEACGRYLQFISVENANLCGAATAALIAE